MNRYRHQPTIKHKSLMCSFQNITTRMRLMKVIVNSLGDATSESIQVHKPITVHLYEKIDIAHKDCIVSHPRT